MEDSTMKTQPAGISSQCRRTDRLLWEAYARSRDQSEIPDRCRLLFPRYRGKKEGEMGKLRVSEQGARFAFVEALCKAGQFRYSVETPTVKTYKFTGKHEESAQTDLTVYDLETRCRLCNVEFKAGGWSMGGEESGEPIKSNVFPIFKDVLKLMREPVWGLWFHLLESTDNSTITNFLGVIREGIGEARGGKHKEDLEAEGLTLHVCVLKHGFSLQKDVPLSLSDSELERHLHFDLRVSREELLEEPKPKLNGWKLNTRNPQD